MRRITHIVIHCTATSQRATVDNIRRHWREALKWNRPGYHRVVEADGTLKVLAADSEVCNGVAGHNSTALHLSYIGGVDAKNLPIDNRTASQKVTMERQIKEWIRLYPEAVICGHRDFPGVKKACPSFSVAAWLKSIKL
jgi:N-acetylmuramoyl-L-alanine amidase